MSSSELNLESFLIPLVEIHLATKNFRSEIKVEQFRTVIQIKEFCYEPNYKVYRGQLSERWQNRTAAIKRFNAAGVVGEEFDILREMFLNEIKMASGFHNESIIPFIGYCDNGNEMILVFEYAIYRCLDHFLAYAFEGGQITWAQRLKFCLEVATGLNYLHSGLTEDTRVIHRDVRSGNIWLNDNMEARISGFGLSTFVPRNKSQVYDGVVNHGYYADPIYVESGIAKTEMDVYSLGVVMFEMLTGMLVYYERSIGDVKPQKMINLVRRYYDVGLDNIIDPHIRDQIDRLSLHMVKEIAFRCISLSIEERPTMKIAFRCISLSIEERPTMSIIIKTIVEALDIHTHGAASIINLRSHQHQGPLSSLIPLVEIKRATNNFSAETQIGDGGFGVVHTGQLSERWQSRSAAFKRHDPRWGQGEVEFLNELQLMSSFDHDNIIGFIGYCHAVNEMIIVTDYSINGSLDQHLKDPNKRRCLTWHQRLKICLGIARGLQYLHSGLGERGRVIHRDAKSANILLDDKMEAKICDFGISILISRNQQQVYEAPIGTPFYVDPIYQESGFLNTETDVYTFGVLLFEMLSGVLAFHHKIEIKAQPLMNMVRRYYADEPDMLVDPLIRDQVDSQSLFSFIEIAQECISFNLKDRPSMNRIIKRMEELLEFQNHGAASTNTLRSHQNRKLEDFLVPLEDIRIAVGNFSSDQLAGGGGFGSVYKGKLSERWQDRTAAIKRLNQNGYQGKNEFRNELELIFRFHHVNIIPFIGYCDQGNEMIIITEYAINGSLDRHLEDKIKRGALTWEQRLRICLGAARGLDYLHSGRGKDNKVVHRDVKSANILLDEYMEAKVCDFGMSRAGPKNQQSTGIYTKTAGTSYYIDPIYQESGKLRTQSDVYSLGVVMFEMLSGLMAYRRKHFGDGKPQYLINLVRRYYNGGLAILMDPLIKDKTDTRSFLTFQEIAYECISMNYKERPTMEMIIDRIEEALGYQETYLSMGALKINDS
nr:protein kinase, ATP binding site-containing protein [Tanacetum cinerariifolium]